MSFYLRPALSLGPHIKICCAPSGREFVMHIGGQECTVGVLLEELYKKAAAAGLWSLVRHTAGMLHKRVEDLGPVSLGIW